MINYLEGILKEKRPTSCTVDLNGIGYKINIPLSTFGSLGELGEKIKLFTSLYIRENVWDIYGFASQKEKDFFDLLNSISGIGPRLALAILSSLSLEDVIRIVKADDISGFTAIPGVGRKIAQRLIFELRERFKNLYLLVEDKSGLGKGKDLTSNLERDAIQALVSLGYKRPAAQEAVRSLKGRSIDNLENLIRQALKKISV